jgi:hypothetical protein
MEVMTRRSVSARAWRDLTASSFRVVILHDDHLTARRGNIVAREIVDGMALSGDCELTLCNVDLLETVFGWEAAIAAWTADVVVVALRLKMDLSGDLEAWLRLWLMEKRNSPSALVVVLESPHEHCAQTARLVVEGIASSMDRDFFGQHTTRASSVEGAEAHELLWVI